MASYNQQSSGTFDQFDTSAYDYQKQLLFSVSGSNGTISSVSISWPVTGNFPQSSPLIEYKIQTTIPFFYLDTTPPLVQLISVDITENIAQVNPNLIYKYPNLGNYFLTSTNGTKPAVLIYHNAGLITNIGPSMFNNAPSVLFGLVYPRNLTVFRNFSTLTTSNSFGFFTLRSIRASSQKIFTVNQTYPKNLY